MHKKNLTESKNFISGEYKLAVNISDADEYEKSHLTALEDIEKWASAFPVDVAFGMTNERDYCLFFQIVADKSLCNSLFHDLIDRIEMHGWKPVLQRKTNGYVKKGD